MKRTAVLHLGLLAGLLVAACTSASRKNVGGNWYEEFLQSPIPEAGGRHINIVRRSGLRWRQVAANSFARHYLGDDCLLFSNLGDDFFVACAEGPARQLAPADLAPRDDRGGDLPPGDGRWEVGEDALRRVVWLRAGGPEAGRPQLTLFTEEVRFESARRVGQGQVAPGEALHASSEGVETLEALRRWEGRPSSTLIWATSGGRAGIVAALLGMGASASCVDDFCPLTAAVQSGDPATVSLLVEHGADVDARDEYGRVPLVMAAGANEADVVGVLLDAGADRTVREDGETAEEVAARRGFSEVLAEFERRPARPGAR